MEDDFATTMRRARTVAAEVRANVQKAKAAAIRDAEDIILRGEKVGELKAKFDAHRAEIVKKHNAVIGTDVAELKAATLELMAMEAELTQFGNALPLADGEKLETVGNEPAKLPAGAWGIPDEKKAEPVAAPADIGKLDVSTWKADAYVSTRPS